MKYKVMIVDDDPMVGAVNKFYVEKTEQCTHLFTAYTVNEAWDFLERYGVDIVLLDMYLGAATGLDLLKRIRKEKKDCQVIVITAAKDKQFVKTAMEYGVCDYLVKPFAFERFEQAMKVAQHRVDVLRRETLSQQDVDELFARVVQPEQAPPKGVDAKTLARITQTVQGWDKEFTVVDMANETNLSRVSVKKYLDYMVNGHVLEARYEYGTVGRPTVVYTYVKS